jgi:hypothetical protein
MEMRLNRKLSVSFNYQYSHHYVKNQIEVPSVPHDYPEIKVKHRRTIGHKQPYLVQSTRAVVWTSSLQFTFSGPSLRPTLIISPPPNLTETRYWVHSKHCSCSVVYGLKSGTVKWLSRLKICSVFSQSLPWNCILLVVQRVMSQLFSSKSFSIEYTMACLWIQGDLKHGYMCDESQHTTHYRHRCRLKANLILYQTDTVHVVTLQRERS